MKLQIQNREITPKEFAEYTLCKLIEDYDNNFVEYAKTMCPDVMSQLNENDIAKLNDWRHKVVVKINKFLGKDKFNG